MTKGTEPSLRRELAGEHLVTSIVSSGEPRRQRQRAMSDLVSALPGASAFSRSPKIVTTPDFHAGKPVPVGVVVETEDEIMPHVVGNDIGCGMRMVVLEGVSRDDLVPTLDDELRRTFFQGGRDIALTGRNRHAILRDGLLGLIESMKRRHGSLADLDLRHEERELDRMSGRGHFASRCIDPDLAHFATADDVFRHDSMLGSIGGGNHFVEIGEVEAVVAGGFARAGRLAMGDLVLVVHSGSLDFGQRIGSTTRARLLDREDQTADPRVIHRDRDRGLFDRYVDGLANAANVALVNRFLIAHAAIGAIARAAGKGVRGNLVYDSPHNVAWTNGNAIVHRKGACTAKGPLGMAGTPYEWMGEPVILPGSMGDGTWLLRGMGNEETLASSAHGAGRRLSRSEARSVGVLPTDLRVVGPLDPRTVRPDIRRELEERLREEAPSSYRNIDSVVDPMVENGMAERVAKIRPLLTVKG